MASHNVSIIVRITGPDQDIQVESGEKSVESRRVPGIVLYLSQRAADKGIAAFKENE